jgi:uncharacterized protein
MFGRFLLWLVVGLVVWWLVKPRRKVAPPTRPSDTRGPVAGEALPEAMVDCAACGLHFPASEAVRDGARVFCCTAHRDAGPKRGE